MPALLTEDDQFDALRRSILQQPYQPGQDLLAGACAVDSADLSGCDLDDSCHLVELYVWSMVWYAWRALDPVMPTRQPAATKVAGSRRRTANDAQMAP